MASSFRARQISIGCSVPGLSQRTAHTVVGAALLTSTFVASAGMLETESARLLPQGSFEFSGAYEYQTSSEGHESAVPLEFEAGLTPWLQLLIEPVVYTSINPKRSSGASGFGDTEATLIGRVFEERRAWPGLALAGEVKFPTAPQGLIGTGKTDYTVFGIASKRYGPFDVHLNIGYTFFGRPNGGTSIKDRPNAALAVVYSFGGRYQVFAEVLSNAFEGGSSEPLPSAAIPASVQEGSSGETSGTIGASMLFGKRLKASFSVTYTNGGAVLIRPGFEYKLP